MSLNILKDVLPWESFIPLIFPLYFKVSQMMLTGVLAQIPENH